VQAALARPPRRRAGASRGGIYPAAVDEPLGNL
jgi:hypothetical protein